MAAYMPYACLLREKCSLNPIALRKAKIIYNFGLSEWNRVKVDLHYPIKFNTKCCTVFIFIISIGT